MLNLKKIIIFCTFFYSSLLLLNSKSNFFKANANSLSVCSGFEFQKIYAVPTANNQISCPNNSSKVIYVSSSGSDSNDGLSPDTPVKSLSNAVKLTRRNSPDWIVLKRGETFDDSFGVIRYRTNEAPLGGRDASTPCVITSYGDSPERPIIQPPKNGIEIWGAFKNITISGLEFRSEPGSGGVGIRTLNGGTNYVVHNNYISGFGTAVILQGKSNANQWFSRVFIKDNVIADSASSGQGHSQGIFAQSVRNLTIEGNVLDTCGWYHDRNGELPGSRIATKFNHCLYLQNGSEPTIVKNNIITRASSHGLQARSGAFVVDNLFARNPIQFFISSKGLNGNANQKRMLAQNNIVLEGNDINAYASRGVGIEHNNAYFALYENNLIAHVLSLSQYNKKAINIVCKTNDVHTSISGQCQSRFRNNFVYNWGTDFDGSLISTRDFNNDLSIEHQITNNQFAIADSQARFINKNNDLSSNKYIFNHNTYINSKITEKSLFSLPGQPNLSFSDWKSNFESTAKHKKSANFVDPCRTMATYYDDIILGNTDNDNCSIMHDAELFEEFMNLAKQKNVQTGDLGIEIELVANYVREGFEMTPRNIFQFFAD